MALAPLPSRIVTRSVSMRPVMESNSLVSTITSFPTRVVMLNGAGVKRRTISSWLCSSISSRPPGRNTRRYSDSTWRFSSSSK